MAGFGDANAFGNLETPILHPKAGHEVQGHVFAQDGLVAGPQRERAFAPVRRIADPDRIAGALKPKRLRFKAPMKLQKQNGLMLKSILTTPTATHLTAKWLVL